MRKQPLKHIQSSAASDYITSYFREEIFGQDHFLEAVLPVIRRNYYFRNSGHAPIGSFFLAGPTGTGKSQAVETFARALHRQPFGIHAPLLTINCGEFQLDHEIAKLIGSPPGYLGHRETAAILTQNRINSVMSEATNTAIILFDEFEKAAPSLRQLLLGVMGGTQLRLGDNNTVSFGRCILFFTSNIGAEILKANKYGIHHTQRRRASTIDWGEIIRQRTSAEFVGRLTAIIPFEHLSRETHGKIIDRIVENVKVASMNLSASATGMQDFFEGPIELTDPARRLLLDTLQEDPTGARNLVRIVAHLLEEAYIDYYEFRKSTGLPVCLGDTPKIGVSEIRRVLRLPAGKSNEAGK
jgi:ATP-dependent Clp protease ATP-binding subunit ClpA